MRTGQHKVGQICGEGLRSWKTGKKISLPFAVLMVWSEPRNHTDDCCFCLVKVEGYSGKNKKDIVYLSVPSTMRSVPHNDDPPNPSTTLVSDNMHLDKEIHDHLGEHDEEFKRRASDGMPQLFSQPELNDFDF
jgi:hypothetical protein